MVAERASAQSGLLQTPNQMIIRQRKDFSLALEEGAHVIDISQILLFI